MEHKKKIIEAIITEKSKLVDTWKRFNLFKKIKKSCLKNNFTFFNCNVREEASILVFKGERLSP